MNRASAIVANPIAKAIAVGLSVLGIVVWWWLPGLRGDGAQGRDPDVVLVGDGELVRGSDVVARRLREEGFSVAEPVAAVDWCDVVDRVADVSARVAVVVHVSADQIVGAGSLSCGDAVDVATRLLDEADRLVVVTGVDGNASAVDPVATALVDHGASSVDVSGLLSGVDGATSCLWWDDCVIAEDGTAYVIVRDDSGLTGAGHQRMARMIVAAVV